jgi:hypothetical protein
MHKSHQRFQVCGGGFLDTIGEFKESKLISRYPEVTFENGSSLEVYRRTRDLVTPRSASVSAQ